MLLNKKCLEILYKAFPDELANDVRVVFSVLADCNIFGKDLIYDAYFEVEVNKELLQIPERVYFNEPIKILEASLTTREKIILYCIFTRHKDGFIRQKYLEKLNGCDNDYIIPYKVRLIGEYVIQILEVINGQVNETNATSYAKFIKENPGFWQKTQARVVSYWAEYYRYRGVRKFSEYVGAELIKKLKTLYQKH